MYKLVVGACQRMKVAENSKLTIGKCSCKSGTCYRTDGTDYTVSFPDNLVLSYFFCLMRYILAHNNHEFLTVRIFPLPPLHSSGSTPVAGLEETHNLFLETFWVLKRNLLVSSGMETPQPL
ncbi:hypothetical protein Nmel_003251 [Mimus melanotis]